MASRRRHIRIACIGAAGVLAAAAVLSDEVLNGRPLGREAWSDLVTGAVLFAAILALLRLSREPPDVSPAPEAERRARAIDEVVMAVSRGGHADAVVESLTVRACEILGVEESIVVMQERSDPRSSIVIAGHGVPADLVGQRFGIDEGMFGQAMLRGEPVLVNKHGGFPPVLAHAAAADLQHGGAVPIRCGDIVRGALAAATTDRERAFTEQDLATLARLAELGAIALGQVAMREQLEEAVESGVEAMAAAVDMRDSYTAEHSDQVVKLARRVGERLGLGEDGLAELGFAARLHDVGKIGVPDAVLQKDGELDSSEWEVIRQHPVWGAEMLGRIAGLRSVAKIVRHGHERWDGDGYPDGLKRDEIPLESRIILACDAYHAMTSDRPYRDALRPWIAVSELREGAGGQFDPDVVDALVKTLRDNSGSTMRLFEPAGTPA